MNTILFLILSITLPLLIRWVGLERSILSRRSTRQFWNLPDMPFLKKFEEYLYAARPHLYLEPALWNRVIKYTGKDEQGETCNGWVLSCKGAMKPLFHTL